MGATGRHLLNEYDHNRNRRSPTDHIQRPRHEYAGRITVAGDYQLHNFMDMSEELRKTAIEGYNREREILTSCITQADSGYASRQTRAVERLKEIDEMIVKLVESRHFVLPPATAYEVQKISDVNKIIGSRVCEKCGATLGTNAPHFC